MILHNIIRVVWDEKQAHIIVNISFFTQVRKLKISNSPSWLRKYNSFYKNIVINYLLFIEWDNEFVFTSILKQVLKCNLNSDKKESYAADLSTNNHKSNLHYTMSDTRLNNSDLLRGFPYINDDNI